MLPISSLRFINRACGTSLIRQTSIRTKRYGWDDTGPIPQRKSFKESIIPIEWKKLISVYPEFLPDPMNNSPIKVHKEIDDMLARRQVIEIPEFYVGSILSVTFSDQTSLTKKSKFVGICIQREGQLKFSNFTLRNVIDGMGCEIRFDIYNPLLLSIEVLKLTKRIDDTLIYLRDALPEYSTIPEDMKPVPHIDTAEVPVDRTLVRMKPLPWTQRWEKYNIQGIEEMKDIPEYFAKKAKLGIENPIYSYDLMMEYRSHVTEEMMYNICRRLAEHEKNVVEPRKAARSKRFINLGSILQSTAEESTTKI